MMAVRVHAFGGPETLVHEEVPLPEPEPGEVLIQVHAASLNPPDWYARTGFANLPEAMRPTLRLPYTPGSDVSGVVAAVGAEVTEWSAGDAVFGLVRFPPQLNNGCRGYAELARLMAAGRLHAGIDSVFPLADASRAHERAERGHIQGKIVLRVTDGG